MHGLARRRSPRPWCHSRHASGQAFHDDLAPPQIPPFARTGRLLVRADIRAVGEHHTKSDAMLLHEAEESLSNNSTRPADEDLGGLPLGPVLMPPENGRQRALPVPCRLGPGPTPRPEVPFQTVVRRSASSLLPQRDETQVQAVVQAMTALEGFRFVYQAAVWNPGDADQRILRLQPCRFSTLICAR